MSGERDIAIAFAKFQTRHIRELEDVVRALMAALQPAEGDFNEAEAVAMAQARAVLGDDFQFNRK